MRRVMIDLETLSTFPNAAVIAVAVAVYDDATPKAVSARGWFIDRDLVIGHEDPSTKEWWESQAAETKRVVFGGNQSPKEAMQEMNSFIAANCAGVKDDHVRLYADPGMFDFPILRHQLQQLGLNPAWNWRNERCMRTMKKELADNTGITIEDVSPEIPHHPVHDCLAQIRELQDLVEIYSMLKHPAQVIT